MIIRGLLIILLSISARYTSGQMVHPVGKFMKDSISVGEHVDYILYISYPKIYDIRFPDSSYNFQPFEYVTKRYFPTKSDEVFSRDSVVYTLRTFENSATLDLSLPIYYLEQNDSTVMYSDPDKVFYKTSIAFVPDSTTKLVEQVKFVSIQPRTNYPVIIIILLTITVILYLLYRFLGVRIKKRFQLYKINKQHIEFRKSFDVIVKGLKTEHDHIYVEKALSHWKNYLSKLESKPIHTYTSTEISAMYNNQDLIQSLNKIDRAIYGRLSSLDAENSVSFLKKFSDIRFSQKKSDLIND